ncbi:MAG: alpha/beta hydrolase [Saprospiraceae bacterium]|nr:alpha/beta hydrolase [Saprospiraceae bacterium]
MRFPFLLLVFFFLFSLSISVAKPKLTLKSYELVKTISVEIIDSIRKSRKVPKSLLPVRYAVKVYEVIYNSKHIDGSNIIASGLYFVPVNPDSEVPLLSYHHGTLIKKEREIGFWREQNFCIGFATTGYAVARPDYHGLGKGEGRHLYCHAESESEAVLNMLRAVQELNEIYGYNVSNKLFLTGYSQGGHATLAVQKKIQEQVVKEFQVIASAPMSGPYNLDGMQEDIMNRAYSHPSYLPYLIYGYQDAYNLFDNVNDVFAPPYDSILPQLYEGAHTLKYINTLLPDVPNQLIAKDFLADFNNNPQSGLAQMIHENNVYDWTPERPVMFCYCKGDRQVNYKQNAKIAYKTMKNNGAKFIRKRTASGRLGHIPCAYVSVMYTRLYFDSFYKRIIKGKKLPKKGRRGDWGNRVLLDLARTFSKGKV